MTMTGPAEKHGHVFVTFTDKQCQAVSSTHNQHVMQ